MEKPNYGLEALYARVAEHTEPYRDQFKSTNTPHFKQSKLLQALEKSFTRDTTLDYTGGCK